MPTPALQRHCSRPVCCERESQHHQRGDAAVAPLTRSSSGEPGYAWLAGGTWLFSTPQIATDTLIDLRSLKWPSLEASETGLDIAATCTIAELYHFKAPADWIAAPLFQLCSRAFLASFKIWNAATVGGNICMSLPAGPMVTLATALEARYTLLPRDGARAKWRRSTSSPATTPTCCNRASSCATSISPPARSISASPRIAPR